MVLFTLICLFVHIRYAEQTDLFTLICLFVHIRYAEQTDLFTHNQYNPMVRHALHN